MTPERWQQVKEVLNAALGRDPHERAAFISKAWQKKRREYVSKGNLPCIGMKEECLSIAAGAKPSAEEPRPRASTKSPISVRVSPSYAVKCYPCR